ncbi:uncharacterized protein LOC115444893 [Manduca sexta]|uniref:uncharacterized protein LOC115444893 n=1 Tax=Manduca sexta TaxID=7130 RepID=UPI00188E4006|nr:uncharacterized protein LOC115444893 [Manduca sexta]
MKPKIIHKCFMRAVKLRKYNNIVEASSLTKPIRVLFGTAAVVVVSTPDGRIETEFSYVGFLCFLFDLVVFFYCTYKVHVEDQTIVRTIYNTKLKCYGDDLERISSFIFALFAMWKVPFSISGSRDINQRIVDIDKAIENMGEIIDYNKSALSSLFITLGQIAEYSLRLCCIWMALNSLGVGVPFEKLYQVVYTDSMSLVLISHYCFLLIVLRDRYKYINKILTEIKNRNAWEYKLFMRTKLCYNVSKAEQLQHRSVCEKINSCAKVYSMLYRATKALNKMFGTCLVLTMLVYLICIILYLFYFMEATASSLFLDANRYLNCLICVFWQIAHAAILMYAIVYFSESTVEEVS